MIQHTTMAIAFSEARASINPYPAKLASQVVDSMGRYSRNRRPMKDWTAKLSFRTASYLKSKGVPLQ